MTVYKEGEVGAAPLFQDTCLVGMLTGPEPRVRAAAVRQQAAVGAILYNTAIAQHLGKRMSSRKTRNPGTHTQSIIN